MKLQFDPTQEYQLDAVRAVTDLFRGTPLHSGDFEAEVSPSSFDPDSQLLVKNNALVVGNRLLLEDETLLHNLQAVQHSHNLEESVRLEDKHFSIEMETGTGKTYVYLRTIYELHRQYRFKKFVIVVPSIAIKEGVMKNLQITAEHFSTLYEHPEIDFSVYDPKKRGQLRTFATANTLQILVINIDSFARSSDSNKSKNIFYQQSDWGVPAEYIRAAHPIVIVDEPQNMETDIRRRAIANLAPLCTLRYSATHRNRHHLIHTLDPVRAYDLGLVKKIEVDSIVSENAHNEAYIRVKSIKATKKEITAKAVIDRQGGRGIQKKELTLRCGDNLYDLSGKREIYHDGYIVDTMNAAEQNITFTNGRTMRVGETIGELTDEIMKFQIFKTVQNHFEKEQRLREHGIKVLSLFFIDRVAHYRNYENGTTHKGKFAVWFEEAFEEVASKPEYRGLIPYATAKVHNGYFSQDKAGFKDTRGNTVADNDTYALIMRDKERLLSTDEPLRFIFSHSALREGWDNPNVFQICTLNESQSEIKKRQEIGRGLRLPVNQRGERVFDESINILTVIANESYEDFAKTLQNELTEDCGVDFGDRVKDKRKRTVVKLRKGYHLDENFKALWERIQHKTKYEVEYDTKKLIEKAAHELREVRITAPKIVNMKAKIDISRAGVKSTDWKYVQEKRTEAPVAMIPDVLGYIQGKTRLTRNTILRIIEKSHQWHSILRNPQQFIDIASAQITTTLRNMMVDGIKYEKIAGEVWEMRRFENEELEGYIDTMFKVQEDKKTLYDHIIYDSNIEHQFVQDLERSGNVKFYLKLPRWFQIKTPIGPYNPDWAVVLEADRRVYFVAETKGGSQTNQSEGLRGTELMKIQCGVRHFAEFNGVEFAAPVETVYDLITRSRAKN